MLDFLRSLSRLRLLALLVGPAVPVLLMAVILTVHVRTWTTERATTNAADAAALVSDFAISPLLTDEDFAAPVVDPQRLDELDVVLQPFLGDDLLRIKIWDATGRVVYSDDRSVVGQSFPISHELEDALAGENAPEISELDPSDGIDGQETGKILEVYVPVSAGGGQRIDGSFELYLPYDPIAESIQADTRQILALLGLVLVVLYLALAEVVILLARSHRRALEQEHQANHDPLTGLPNRRKFQTTLEGMAATTKDMVAVLLLDLDDFKTVNDRHGHHVGDEFLTAVAGRLEAQLRGDASMARIGGDEFAILLPSVRDLTEVHEVARRLISSTETPIRLGDLELDAGASIGIDIASAGTADPLVMQRNADAAMYMAKAAGKGQFATFDPVLHEHLTDAQARGRTGADSVSG